MQYSTDNYFELFAIPQTYEVDLEALAARYRELQNETHPDRQGVVSEQEKLRAVQLTSLINEAYGTLKSPLRRAGYLLTLHDLDTEQVSQSDLGMDLLMEQMQLRESLEGLPEDESALDELAQLKKETQGKITRRQEQFASALTASDLPAAKRFFHEMQFLDKLLKEINSGEEQRLGY